MANDKNFRIKNGLLAGRYLLSGGTETASNDGPFGVFSTTLFVGDGTSSQTITNSIDLSGDGGLVWMKSRDTSSSHWLYDTERGVTKELLTNSGGAESTESTGLTAFNSDGFTIGTRQNQSAYTGSVSWTFKKEPNFFDVVTYTGNGVAGRTVSHSLGAEVGCLIVKNLNDTENWQVYHRSTGNAERLLLNQSLASGATTTHWNSTTPTSSVFTVGTHNGTNSLNDEYVAYLFAHDTASNSNIKCGGYTKTGSSQDIDLGWSPSWLLLKRVSTAGSWYIMDTQRGFTTDAQPVTLKPDSSDVEGGLANVKRTSTGFNVTSNAGEEWIYIAIRAVVPKQTLDLSTGNTFSLTLTEATDVLFTNPPASGTAVGFTVEVVGDGSAITWPSSVEWHLGTAPVATASKEVYAFVTTDGGTTYYGRKAAENLA